MDLRSEVLGYDDEMSQDHDWGPRVLLFLHDDDHERHGDALQDMLRELQRGLPAGSADRSAYVAVHTVPG